MDLTLSAHTIPAFNTGRGYTSAGQRIAFMVLPDRRAYFYDVDRGIDGVIPAPIFEEDSVDARYILAEYDAGNYQNGFTLFNLREPLRAAGLAI
jgi:hypothetical protein